MNKNKKNIIFSIIATILVAVTIFLIISYQNQKTQQQLQQEIVALKKEHDQLLTQIPKNVNWQSYVDEFYSAQVQKIFQQQKEQIKKEIADLKVNVTCNQSDLKAQKQCWLNFNQKINQTISNFHHFNDSYYDSYQTFNTTLNTAKKQFDHDVTLITTNYDFGFLSFENQTALQNDQKQILSNMTKLIDFMCDQNKALYQQLVCFQQQKQLINNMTKFRNFDRDYQHLYQTFNNTFRETKKQFDVLLLKIAAFNNKEYNSDFFSPAEQVVFQNNKSQVMSNVQEINHSTCSQNKTLYQQLVCYQEKNAIMNETIKNFNSFDDDYHHNYQIFNATLNTAKKQFDALLANLTAINNFHHSDNDIDFLKPQKQIEFQNNKNQIINMKEHFNNSTCSQNKMLYQQLSCYQEKNQEMNKTINYFDHFDDYYRQMKQKFAHDFQDAKEQLTYLSTTMTEIDITTFNNTPYDFSFLSLEKQNEFQKNKSEIMSQVQQFNYFTCFQNKNLYQQLLCYQEKDQTINKMIAAQQQACAKKSSLYQQLSCYQEKNQEMNKTINYFNHFGDHYQQIKQKFYHDLQDAKEQLVYLLTTMTEIDITAFNNTPYDLGFLSLEKQNEFQKNKSEIISNVQKINNSTCSQNKMLKCYQEKNQTINDEIVVRPTCAKKGSFYQLLCYQEKDQTINKMIAAQQQACAKKSSLYQQLWCYQEKNQEMNKTINYFNHFDDYYQQMKQEFDDDFQIVKKNFGDLLAAVTTLDQTEYLKFLSSEEQLMLKQIVDGTKQFNHAQEKECLQNKNLYQQLKCYQENINILIIGYNQIESKKQFLNLTAQISSLDVDELKTTEFTLNFFSFEQKVTFQDNKKIIINNLPPIQKKIPSITEKLEFYQKFGTIYQQIVYCQQYIQTFAEQLAFCQNFKKQYFEAFKLSLAVENIKSGIKKIQTELEDIFMQNPNNVIENKIAIILEKIMDFEKKVKAYEKQPWSQFRAYHDFLAQHQEYFVETKHYVDNIIENIAVIKAAYTNNDIVSLISTINFNKEHVKLLTQMPKNVNWQFYVDDFYDEQTQKQFQNQKDKLQQEIKDLNLKVNVVNCDDQSNLEAQKQCWLNFNQKMNQTINNFHHFNDSYYDSYQTFNTTLNTTKKQFFNNLVNISKLNTTEFNNTVYDLNFLSPEKQNEFQSNKSQIINTIKQFNNSQSEQIATCSQNKTLYQQLVCYQEKNAIINETIKNFNSFDHDYHHNYQIFNATFNATKKQFDDLLINMTTLKKSEYSEDFELQRDRNQIIMMIRQFNTIKEIKCFQNKNLYQQAKCYQKNVAYLMTDFDQVKAKKKFLELKDQFLTLNISELTNINVNFLSLKKQKELLKKQKNLIKVISQIQNKLQNNIKLKPYNNFYPQPYHPSLLELQYYQKQNQQIVAQLKIFQTFKKQYFDSFESSLFTLIAKIKVGIKLANEKQQELTILQKAEQNAIITIAAARTQNITQKIQNVTQRIQNITQKIQNVTQNVANFEKEIKQYANLPWSQFKAYHDFLVKYQNILQVSKEDIFEAKSIIEFIITGGTIFDEENI